MAPIKLEDHIREQFEEREIAPSAGAWDKLESKLDKEQGKKRPLFIWYAVAASIIGMVFITSQFFLKGDTQIEQELVEVEAENKSIEKPSTSEIVKTQTQLAQDEVVNDKKDSETLENKLNNKKASDSKRNVTPVIETKKSRMNSVNDTRMAVQENDASSNQKISAHDSPEALTEAQAINKNLVLNTKVDEVVAAIQGIQKDRNTVTAAEIDALLQTAQRDIATQRILNETKIDATALLNDVEFELEKTFRDKVFDALGDSFSKIRTAVVERNN